METTPIKYTDTCYFYTITLQCLLGTKHQTCENYFIISKSARLEVFQVFYLVRGFILGRYNKLQTLA